MKGMYLLGTGHETQSLREAGMLAHHGDLETCNRGDSHQNQKYFSQRLTIRYSSTYASASRRSTASLLPILPIASSFSNQNQISRHGHRISRAPMSAPE